DPPELNDARVLAAVRRALDEPTDRWAWLRGAKALWAGLAVAAAAAAVVFTLRPVDPQPGVEPPGVRMKGALRLHVLRQVAGGAEPVASGEAIHPEDRLAFQVTLPERARVTVVGVEPTGTLYTAWPLPEHHADPVLDAGLRQALPGAVSLDGPKGVEHLYLVACPPEVEDAACEGAGADQPPACAESCRLTPFRFVRP
ncbi:MAG: hypothetical protein KC613_09360, partial [Myxococcales bacterium]|nr:hypothetical protein [Myxococcales bacterium]